MVKVKEIKNYKDFEDFVNFEKEMLHVVKLGAKWCGPCNTMTKTISSLDSEKVKNVLFAEVDIEIEENDDIVAEFNIRSIPVTIFIKNGEIIEKKVGGLTSDMLYNTIYYISLLKK